MNNSKQNKFFPGLSENQLQPPEKRRSDRVILSIPVEVSGIDLSGEDFVEKGLTKVLSRYGAAIIVNRVLGPEQVLTVKRVGGRSEAQARVIGQISSGSGGHVYGMALLEPVGDFWGIAFPTIEESRDAFMRVLLECASCHTREVALLNEIEFMVFEANDSVRRDCRRCRDHSVWKLAQFEAPTEPEAPLRSEPSLAPPAVRDVELEAPAAKAPPMEQPEKPRENRRKHPRVKVSLKGCILLTRPEEKEIIEVLDMSRTGIRFTSARKFLDNMWVQVAVPYMEGAGNIFQSARIAWRRPHEKKGFEYGLKYAKS